MLNAILSLFFKKRLAQIERFKSHPFESQEIWLQKLLSSGQYTSFGQEHRFKGIKTAAQFRERVPVMPYEKIFPYIERSMRGEKNVLWPGRHSWFSKSSGTTNARSKYIPVTQASLHDCHFKGGLDLYSIYISSYSTSNLWKGKGLAIGGSHQINEYDPSGQSRCGDISALLMQCSPLWTRLVRSPSFSVAFLSNWEEKIKLIARETAHQNITHIAGVPTWTALLLQHLLEQENKNSMEEIWPNLEVFFHGAVSFAPYKNLFQSMIKHSGMRYWETYNASEGFFGVQDVPNASDMLLLLDHGIYYEFIPLEEMEKEFPIVLDLSQIEIGKNYALVISTNGGLWRYLIGDTVKFTSTKPFRIKVSGRTKHFINAFGEEIIVENAEEAISRACEKTGAVMANYTAAPVFLDKGKRGGHEWVIEFHRHPENIQDFIQVLDDTLRQINSDYDAKRAGNLALLQPKVHVVKENTFYEWMKQRGKLGGQNKVPRLSNSREYVEEILSLNS